MDSPQYKTLQEKMDLIIEVIEGSIPHVAPKLLARDLVKQRDVDAAIDAIEAGRNRTVIAQQLMKPVITKVKLEPDSFYKLIDAFNSCELVISLGKELEKHYAEKGGKKPAASTASTSSGSRSGTGSSGGGDARPSYNELIEARSWDQVESIAHVIAQHSATECDNFANLLLKNKLFVKSTRRNNPDNEAFVNEILQKWTSSVDGPAMPCTWRNLIDCMRSARLTPDVVQTIEQHVCS